MTLGWRERMILWRAGLSFRETLRNGPTETSESSTKASAKSRIQKGISPCSGKGWGLIGQTTALQERIGSLGGKQVEQDFPVQEQH